MGCHNKNWKQQSMNLAIRRVNELSLMGWFCDAQAFLNLIFFSPNKQCNNNIANKFPQGKMEQQLGTTERTMI